MKTFIICASIFLGICILIFCVLLVIVLKLRKILFKHRQDFDPEINTYTKEEFNLKDEKIIIPYKKEYISAHLYNVDDNYDKDKLVIVCHGMFSTKESYMQDIGYLANKGLRVLALEYFGVGESSGKDQIGVGNSVLSTKIVLDYIATDPRLKDLDLYVYGHSWGGYAAINSVRFNKNIKGVIAIAPFVSISTQFRQYTHMPCLVMEEVEFFKMGKYGCYNGYHALKKFDGRVLIIQSEDDSTVPFKCNGWYLLAKLRLAKKQHVSRIILKDRDHQPHYTKEAVAKYVEMNNNFRKMNSEERKQFLHSTDLRQYGVLDPVIMDQIVFFIKK